MFMVLEMDVVVAVPFVVMWLVLPLEPPHGPPFEHENHINCPLHRIASIYVAFVVLLSPKWYVPFLFNLLQMFLPFLLMFELWSLCGLYGLCLVTTPRTITLIGLALPCMTF
jgi:hypothetical protein